MNCSYCDFCIIDVRTDKSIFYILNDNKHTTLLQSVIKVFDKIEGKNFMQLN